MGLRTGAAGMALALCAGAAVAQGTVPPFADAAATKQRGSDEERAWFEAADFDRALRRSGALRGDRELDAYLQQLLDGLFPEFQGAVRVQAVRDPVMNAFALPNGSLYVNLGLIARMENEAQLASVLGHEAAHFVHRHSFQQRTTAKDSAGFALVIGVVTGGVGALVANVVALNAIYGYSRDFEREADRIGFERVARLGYDAAAGARTFELLAEEAKILKVERPVFFASHPQLEERIASFKELAAARKLQGGELGAEAFLARTAKARAEWPPLELSRGKAESLAHVLSDPQRRARYPAGDYWLGEAYRLRAQPDDDDRAAGAYARMIEREPDFAPAYRGLGVVRMKQDRAEEAAQLFKRYLALAPQAPDAGFIRQYLADIEPEDTSTGESK